MQPKMPQTRVSLHLYTSVSFTQSASNSNDDDDDDDNCKLATSCVSIFRVKVRYSVQYKRSPGPLELACRR